MEKYANTTQGLPTDILIEVFCRLPVKTLVQLCCVCKFWKNLIRSDHIFIRCHLKESLKKTSSSSRNVLMYSDWNAILTSELHDLSVQRFINADENCLRKSFFLGPGFLLVGCINGIFCLYKYPGFHLYLWNPALHECRILPRSGDYVMGWFDVVGFFSEPTDDDYMAVKILMSELEVQIYNLSSNSWKKIDFPYYPYGKNGKSVSIRDKVAVVHNGALHWLSYCWEDTNKVLFLNVLDLSKKKFQETLLSDLIPLSPFLIALGLSKGCLCLLGTSTTEYKYEVWMMKEYGVENSWTKQFQFPRGIIPHCYMSGFKTSGKFVVNSQDCVVLYNTQRDEVEFVQEEPILYCTNMKSFFTDNYAESLVSVFSQDEACHGQKSVSIVPPHETTPEKTLDSVIPTVENTKMILCIFSFLLFVLFGFLLLSCIISFLILID